MALGREDLHRSKGRGAARLVGRGIVLTIYLSGVLYAADLTAEAAPSAPRAANEVTVQGSGLDAESPAATLALAASGLAIIGAIRVIRALMRRERAPVRSVTRRVSTLT
jgi:hypothetical protein